jgi:chromosomal replication initiation ATPase DnaA
MEANELISLSLPELYSLISDNTKQLKEQQEYCDYLFQILDQKRELEKYEAHLRKIAAAERIERKISIWIKKNWYRFQFMYRHYKCRKIDILNVRSDSHTPNVILPRQIMIYFITQLSGLDRVQICEYFELNQRSDISYAITKIEEYMKNDQFAYLMNTVANIL